jgi:hypothetical protein
MPRSPRRHPEGAPKERVSKDGRTLPCFETRRCATLLTMTVSWAAADRPVFGQRQILGVLVHAALTKTSS